MKNRHRTLVYAFCFILFANGACKRKAASEAVNASPPEKKFSGLSPSEPPPPAEGPEQKPTPSPTPITGLDLAKLARDAGPAVILVSVFDATGKLMHSTTGFFVSDNGRLVTNAHLIAGAENAVAKTADGKIYNVTGILSVSSALDVAVLKADVKRVPFLSLNRITTPAPGIPVAVIASPLQKNRPPLEGKISGKSADANGDLFELTPAFGKEVFGSPVVDDRGELVGIATSADSRGETPVIVRPLNLQMPLLASIAPTNLGRWGGMTDGAGSPTPTPSPRPSPTPKPKGTPAPGDSKLVHRPAPPYPAGARLSNPPITGSGRFRVTFGADGTARRVEIVQSTGHAVLDAAATNTLRQWRAVPGQEWTTNVPVTFGR
jgi:TonB family protein